MTPHPGNAAAPTLTRAILMLTSTCTNIDQMSVRCDATVQTPTLVGKHMKKTDDTSDSLVFSTCTATHGSQPQIQCRPAYSSLQLSLSLVVQTAFGAHVVTFT